MAELLLISAGELVPKQHLRLQYIAARRGFEKMSVMPKIYVRQVGDPTGGDVYQPATTADGALVQAVADLDPSIKLPVFLLPVETC